MKAAVRPTIMPPGRIVPAQLLPATGEVAHHGSSTVRHIFRNSIWACASCAAILTNKFLITEQNYHYPFHLLCIQVTAALVVVILQFLRLRLGALYSRSAWVSIHDGLQSPQSGRAYVLKVSCAALFPAISLLLAAQAILHWQNLSTLAMSSVIVYFFDLLLLRVLNHRTKEISSAFPIVLLGLCSLILIYDDYRLTVQGIVFLSLATIFAGASRTAYRITMDADHSLSILPNQLRNATLVVAVALSALCSFVVEDNIGAFHTLSQASPSLLWINILTSVIAILLGGSIIAPLNVDREVSSHGRDNLTSLIQPGTTFAYAGASSMISLCFTPRGYTSSWQLASFGGAILTMVWATHTARRVRNTPEALDDTEMLYFVEAGPRDQDNVTKSMSRMGPLITTNTFLLAGTLWIGFLLGNFEFAFNPQENQTRLSYLSLDRSYAPQSEFDIVISMHKESVPSVNGMLNELRNITSISESRPRVFIYTKDEDLERKDVLALQKATQAYNVTKLPNHGREGSTYLHHITSQWDMLAQHTLFIQADIHNPREFFPRIRDYYSKQTGMLSLGFAGMVCDLESCSDRWGWTETADVLMGVCNQIPNAACQGKLLLSYKGQFIVSAARIRGIKHSIYEDLYQAMDDPTSWAHSDEYLHGRSDSLNAPRFGYTLERIWSMLFQCSNAEVAWRCPSLLSGVRRDGDASDCQCYDPPDR